MAQKKPSGLGRGLGELLYDNSPEVKGMKSNVTVKREGETIRITPAGSAEKTTRELFETKPKNRSVKSNFVTKK